MFFILFLLAFLNAFKRTYIFRMRGVNERAARFPPITWNQNENILNHRQRSNNAVEGFHAVFGVFTIFRFWLL